MEVVMSSEINLPKKRNSTFMAGEWFKAFMLSAVGDEI